MLMSLSMFLCRRYTAITIATIIRTTQSNYQHFKHSLQRKVDNGWVLLQIEVIPSESLTKRNEVQTKLDDIPQGGEAP